MTLFNGTNGDDILPLVLQFPLALGNDVINGLGGDDLMVGNLGDDILCGGLGSDVMIGGILTIDILGDTSISAAGRDTVTYWDSSAGVTIDLANTVTINALNILGLELDLLNAVVGSGGDAEGDIMVGMTDLIGSAYADNLAGNDDANMISGLAGNDILTGAGGNDMLFGGDGRDRLDGGTGDDQMTGGLGDDHYVVDSGGDQVLDEIGFSLGGGIDTVASWITYTLGANVEILRLQGGEDLDGTGNGAPEVLVGNIGANVLTGNYGNDRIVAKAGNDTLIGGNGQDELVGDEGADTFVYLAVSDSRAGVSNRDLINGFDHGADLIDLSAIDANSALAGDDAFSFIDHSAFSGTAGEVRLQNLGGPNAILVEADQNGDGVADMQIIVLGTLTMTASDFML